MEYINISDSSRILDTTFGEGGHALSFLKAGAEKVVALDRDADALKRFQKRHTETGERIEPRLELHHARMTEAAALFEPESFTGILADLGPSTRQLLDPERGFTFKHVAPADFRMDRDRDPSLMEKLAESSPEELGLFLQDKIGVKGGRKLARKIFERMALNAEPLSTGDLAKLLPPAGPRKNPATELFLGLRMWVNDEWGEVERGLPDLVRLLKPGGRLVVLTFHSTEDRLVKNIFRTLSGIALESDPIAWAPPAQVKQITRKPAVPTSKEVFENPRARSTKLRCVEKIGHTE